MRKLIIFDCDGTLVDSELLYNTITSELLAEIGLDEYTPQRCVELFAGQSWWVIKQHLEAAHNIEIHDAMVRDFVTLSAARLADVEATPLALETLEALSKEYTICVASNGERGGVIKSLKVTGLDRFFSDNTIFTKIQVEHPKPAPDLFLFAAEQMGYSAKDCIVIEDSTPGATAGRAAEMFVIGYTGCSHNKQAQEKALYAAGADTVIDSLIHIRNHL